MKILVIDDTKKHLDAALQILVGHDVTVCSSHDEALKLLYPQYDDAKLEEKKTQYKSEGMSNWDAYCKAQKESVLPYWDAVLCDLLMPAGRNAQGGEGEKFVGQEMAVGWSLALQAAQGGAKFVAVITDMNHHHHPASAMLDNINGHIFSIDASRMLLTNHVSMIGITGTECTCRECCGSGKKNDRDCWKCNGTGQDFTEKGKDWGKILEKLLGENSEEE